MVPDRGHCLLQQKPVVRGPSVVGSDAGCGDANVDDLVQHSGHYSRVRGDSSDHSLACGGGGQSGPSASVSGHKLVGAKQAPVIVDI
ncbi:hypothetical protein A8144_13890 [Mycobacterium leprae 3125609]|nr:hypothetical protein A8144_13890 [Mycobacterium leprae 3125609]OAX70135.1 hypothetical protein A3216_13845 [Mycobacterium leprae 7935681]